ncbi:NADP-dependent 3-hydroxy acid dehydrogenase YdfG [Bryocella elongata]|uniref:NADP-dependent 3-hydroxy acid dehydrogenase YdfG n=1 Tax=Bryocella elongata TaxID=863522 RepID=A0A1H6AHY7_9BACT|nr:oxidoreductase [Bryocella elongata]SEG48002.1 NADP-dependent 3-hydroxy acid dehydrogenase YdfG [Bryocella elongata]
MAFEEPSPKAALAGDPTSQSGKNWFITGASTGFGFLLTEYLATLGAKVIATARKPESLAGLAAKYPGNVFPEALDVTKPGQIEAAVSSALAKLGYIDVLVNNAGYGVNGAIEEVSEDELRPMFETNVFGLLGVTKALLPQFRARRSGSIVNLSSIGGLIGSPGWGYYNATKFAVEGLSQALAGEMAPLGVNVTVVEPGPFRTDFLGRSGQEAAVEIDDYRATAGKAREYLRTQSGLQPGDPQKAIEAIVAAVSAPHPPKHLVLGKIAIQRWKNQLTALGTELEQWEAFGAATDFE